MRRFRCIILNREYDGGRMSRFVKAGLIQAGIGTNDLDNPERLRAQMLDKHLKLISDASRLGVQVLCLQELFYSSYFPAEETHPLSKQFFIYFHSLPDKKGSCNLIIFFYYS